MKYTACRTLLVLAAVFVMISEIDGRTKRPGAAERRRQRRLERRRNRENRTQPPTQRPCPPIPHVTNGQGLDDGNTIQYACEPGYVLEGTNVITCLDGRWTVAPRCRRQLCNPPTNAVNANQPELSNGGTSATYTCLPGFEIAGTNGQTSMTINCNIATQFWPVPTCTQRAVQSCGAPPTISNSQTTLSATGTSATYTCITGYTLRAGTPSMLTCTNNVWPTTNRPICDLDATNPPTPLKCLKAPPCGDEKVVREDVTDSYEIGGKVKYTCVSGYRIVGGNSNTNMTGHAYCLSTGTWSVTPTCERKNCGKPAEGTQTVAVVATGTMFGDTYNYTCNANYETGMLTSATCMADGMWSIPAPTCTQKKCKAASFPTLVNANYAPVDTVIGGTISVSCHGLHRLAPVADPTVANLPTEFTLTCQSDGNFSTPTQHCVYQHPENCTDYFRRDASSFFTNHDVTCDSVTIDPQGPAPSTDTTNPGPATVQCCRQGTNEVCTQAVATPSQTPHATSQSCAATTSTIMTGTGAAGTTEFCAGSLTTISYSLSNAEILSMIQSSSGTCSQITTVRCSTTTTDASVPVLKFNGQGSGLAFGTAGISAGDFTLTDPTYAGQLCDCSLASTAPTTNCEGGCYCVTDGGVSPSVSSDTITRYLTAGNPEYVTDYQYLRGDTGTTALIAVDELVIDVGAIQCCETFTA